MMGLGVKTIGNHWYSQLSILDFEQIRYYHSKHILQVKMKVSSVTNMLLIDMK